MARDDRKNVEVRTRDISDVNSEPSTKKYDQSKTLWAMMEGP